MGKLAGKGEARLRRAVVRRGFAPGVARLHPTTTGMHATLNHAAFDDRTRPMAGAELEQRTRARIRLIHTTHGQICRFDRGCMK